jgi:phytoene dehydrogenase-like protein
MSGKRVVIIGGGVAGLTSGIYLQQAGFETHIYEKHSIVGGECTGWKREGYLIDNCIHWLTGTKEGSDLNQLWKNVGALGDEVELIRPDFFYRTELNGERLTLWRDLERTRREMLALSPEDAEEIKKFLDYTKLGETMGVPVQKPFDMFNVLDIIKIVMSMADIGKIIKEYGTINISEMADRFKHPLIKIALKDYLPIKYQANSLLLSYATITGNNGDIPRGGSLDMAMRMQKRYESLGGHIHTSSPVNKVTIQQKNATGIELENGESVPANYVVCACDTDYTFQNLLDSSYMPKDLKEEYEKRKSYPVVSGFQVAFAVDGQYPEHTGMNFFDCEPLLLATKEIRRMNCKGFEYEPSFSPEGKGVVQSTFSQSEEDYNYWVNLYNDSDKYRNEKLRLAEEIKNRVIRQYPLLEGKIRVLDVWTPATYNRYVNAYCGAYMSFIITKGAKNKRVAGKIKGLGNVMIASQWLMGPGGLPTAAAMGKFAAQRIMKREKMSIKL